MRGKWFVVSSMAGLLGLVLAPRTASAWECSVDLQKCVVVDTDKDGDYGDEDCVDPGQAMMGEKFKWVIVVKNTGENDLGNCVVTDDVGAGWSFDTLAAGDKTYSVMKDVCDAAQLDNAASVTCTECAGESGTWTDDDTAQIVCEEKKQCFTRSPGYWGTHPDVTASLLPVTSCGLDLTNIGVEEEGSAIEDLCKSGDDFKANGVSPQRLSLVRQCTAAALNIAATDAMGGDCGSDVAGLIASCCDTLCTSDASGQTISESGCIEMLDAFNNGYEDAYGEGKDEGDYDEGKGEENGDACSCTCKDDDGYDDADESGSKLMATSANPSICQAARGNGFINTRPPEASDGDMDSAAQPMLKAQTLKSRTAPAGTPQLPQKPTLLRQPERRLARPDLQR